MGVNAFGTACLCDENSRSMSEYEEHFPGYDKMVKDREIRDIEKQINEIERKISLDTDLDVIGFGGLIHIVFDTNF